MKKLILSSMLVALVTLPAFAAGTGTTSNKITTVTRDNYGLAETQVIFTGYVKKIAAATDTNGVGVFWHVRKGADPKDRTIPRINFDTIYSWAIVDLKEDVTLTMPQTGGRYQSAWIISEEHYNPMAFEKPGVYLLTEKNVGTRYAAVVIRTQANTADPADLAGANKLQDQVVLTQKNRGSYVVSHSWDMDEILEMRAHYEKLAKDKGITSDVMFGKKGEVPLENHNAGSAVGWGGFTPQQAVYPLYYPTSTAHQTLTLKDVPTKAFWSITVYNEGGFAETDTYNINSQFAVKNNDGSVTINFGGDKNAVNYMETFDGWNFALRIYQPQPAYFNGDWVKPELKLVGK